MRDITRRTIAILLTFLLVAPAFARTVPVAVSFSTAVAVNSATVLQLQGSDGEGTPLTFSVVGSPAHGAVSQLNASTGVLLYTPTASYAGSDSFTYKVTSGGEDSATATVSITVTAAKTRVVHTFINPDASPRRGKVTFVLTQNASSPSGLIPAKSSVSCVLTSSGQCDVSLYPSVGLNPVQWYQVYFFDASGGSQLLGLSNVPATALPAISLDGTWVVDMNLAAQRVFASVAEVQAYAQAISSATLATLNSSQITTALGYTPQPLDSDLTAIAGLSPSANGALQFVSGAWAARTTAQLKSSLAIAAGDVSGLGTMATQNASNVAITGGTLNGINGGTLNNVTCVGCTNLGTGTAGGIANTGDTVIASNTDANLTGKISLQAGGVERASIEADGTLRGFTGRSVYASKAGAALDSNLTSGGGTDDTAALQAVLDTASASAPLRLVIDGVGLSGQLRLRSYTTLECTPGAGLRQKNALNKSMLVNQNPSASTVTDTDITIRGCTFNGNFANQTGTGLFSTQEADGNLIGLVQLFGVNNLRLENLHLIGSKTIAAHVGNLTNLYVNDLYIDNNLPGQVQGGGLQIEGPAQYVQIANLRGSTEDDLLALNTDDCVWVNGAHTGLGPNVSCGAITDVTATNIVGMGAGYGIRTFNATNRIDRVRISNISGTFLMRVWHNDPLTIGPGNIGTFVVDGINVTAGTAPFPTIAAFIDIYGRAEHLVFRDVNISGLVDTRPAIKVNAGAEIQNLDVSGMGIVETSSVSAGMIPVKVDGYVKRLTGTNWRWSRDPFLGYATDFLKITGATGQVEELTLNGVNTNRVNRIVYHPTGRLNRIALTHVEQMDALGGVTVATTGAVGDVTISNWFGEYAVPFTGTALKKRGDAFPADTTAPTYSTGVAAGGAPFVVVTFSEPVNSSNLALGVTIKKNTVAQTISSAKRREYDPFSVEYVLSSNLAGGDTVTWEYAAASGDYADTQNNVLANVAAQAVTVSRTGYVYDLFTAADGTAVNARAPSPLTAGNNWATLIGTAGNQTIRGNRLRSDASSATQSTVVDAGAANVIAYATLTATSLPASGAGVGIIFRASDASNYWLVWVTNDATRLIKVVAGVTAVVQTVSAAHFPGVPYVVSVTANGSAISATVSGGETVSTTDAFNSTATKHGVHAAGAVMAADDFTVVSAP